MRVKLTLTIVALTSICQMVCGTTEWRYRLVVTNVLDATHVIVDWRRHPYSEFAMSLGPVLLDGIAAPEKGSLEGEALLNILKKTLLGKQVNGVELLDGGESRGASLYVTDDPRRRAPEDNVNLMLVREGFARYSGEWNSGDGNLGGMAEAQRLAQEERKGIWAHEPVPAPPPPSGRMPPPLLALRWRWTSATRTTGATVISWQVEKLRS